MKIISFISSLITFVVGLGVSILSYIIIQEGSMAQGLAVLGNVILIPIAIILLLISVSCSISALFTSIGAVRSDLTIIKVLSIILLILSLILVGFVIYNVVGFIKLF